MPHSSHRTFSIVFSTGLVAGLAACAVDGQPEPTPEASPLRIAAHDDQQLAGTFDAGDLTVTFQAESPAPLVGVVWVMVGDATLSLSADAGRGEIAFDGNLSVLDDAEHAALAAFSRELDGYLGEVDDLAVMHDSVLVVAARYFAEAPVDAALTSVVRHVATVKGDVLGSTGNNGKTCIKTGQWVTATYDGDAGTTSETWNVGSSGGQQWNGNFDCMGRCGVGCGSYDWTLDCLEHDACSRRYYSSSGAADHNCGDEYLEAADDYAAFWTRCRS
ncbi:MAG: hypothetical protein H6709_01445 [Kofleriaceae bacterium]|nr:hypothetical protein [Myxococcales bacterium]MCB9562505.1 hypothetical protein [Kofleriaceae bacterium]MCB9570734.1 hypothetical protein [Kofleriaceae bacterium]